MFRECTVYMFRAKTLSMPGSAMGLASAPATFQRLIQATMSDFAFQFLLVYLDDLLVYSKTFDEHMNTGRNSKQTTCLCRDTGGKGTLR